MRKRLLSFTTAIILSLILVQPSLAITWETFDYPGATYTNLVGIDGSNVIAQTYGGLFLYDGTTWTSLPIWTIGTTGFSGRNITNYNSVYNLDSKILTTLNPTAFTSPIYNIDGSNIATVNGIYNLDSKIFTTLSFPGASSTEIDDIDGDNMVGRYYLSGSWHSFLYDGTTWTALDFPEGIGGDINGFSGKYITTRFGVYNIDNKVFTELNFPGAFFTVIDGIDGDKIIGQYLSEGNKHGFIATIPEPASAFLVITGMGLFRLRRGKKLKVNN